MESELSRRCGRLVRVAEFVTSCHSLGNVALEQVEKLPLFAGYVETIYANHAMLGLRLDIWESSDICCRKVQSTSCYMRASGKDTLKVASGKVMSELLKVKETELRIVAHDNDTPALSCEELTQVLEDAVKECVQSFRELQVQTLMTATSQRAKFEYEMLQHYSGLEIAVLESQVAGVYVLFALPLLGDDSSWDPKSLAATGEPGDVYVPDGFSTPNFAVATDTLTIAMGYPLSDNDNDEAWPLVVEWPVGMKLSSQVTQIPSTSKGQSSIELITSCKKMFMQQWRYRKDFIGELRHHVIVLEYDPIDFSHVFFLLQEQLDAVSPLRILVLRLQFSAEFFLTNCTSDLQISLLDGEASTSAVSLELPATSIVANCEEAGDSQKSVVQFLEATRKSLLKHFYGE